MQDQGMRSFTIGEILDDDDHATITCIADYKYIVYFSARIKKPLLL